MFLKPRLVRSITLPLLYVLAIVGPLNLTVSHAQEATNLPSPELSPESPANSPIEPDIEPSIGPSAVPQQKTSTTPPVDPQNPTVEPGKPSPDVVNPTGTGQYVLEFSRAPIVGHRLRLQGIYDESRLRFTRPRNWQPRSLKIMLRYRHSSALYATRSNLTVLVNGTSVGSVPLNRKQGETGTTVYDIPANIVQDHNEVVIAALQNNSPTCTQDPFDPSLWTEILPDSKLVFNFQPQPVPLDFSRYPYPVFDTLSLEPNRVAYQLPEAIDEAWLTTAARFQASLGRIALYRPLETRLTKTSEGLKPSETLIVIGTPKTQRSLATLNLPLPIKNDQILDEKNQPFPPDVGVLMLSELGEKKHLVLVATGNGPDGVAKAVQFLVQGRDRQLGTGRSLVVKTIEEVPSPKPRDWPAYLPISDTFGWRDLRTADNQPLQDVTVRGADAPVIETDFRALPDDRFERGSEMKLVFSYSPQVNPLTSMVEVQLDGIPITGKRLDSDSGAVRQTLPLLLPEERIKPHSKLQVRFQLDPRERRSCNRATDQQLWATVHADTSFRLNRHNRVTLPDLQLLQYGFPFTAPQDLSNVAIALKDQPSPTELGVLFEVAERLGRLSKADSIKLTVHRIGQLPEAVRRDRQLIAIGTRDKFPLPEAFEQSPGFSLQTLFSRQLNQSQLQTLPDDQGVVKAVLSPWNGDRVLLALSAQTDKGLEQVRDLWSRDDLFFQLKQDTTLIKANLANPSPYDPQAYTLEFLSNAPVKREVTEMNAVERTWQFFRLNWFTLIPVTVIAAFVLYGVFQAYLNRIALEKKKS